MSYTDEVVILSSCRQSDSKITIPLTPLCSIRQTVVAECIDEFGVDVAATVNRELLASRISKPFGVRLFVPEVPRSFYIFFPSETEQHNCLQAVGGGLDSILRRNAFAGVKFVLSRLRLICERAPALKKELPLLRQKLYQKAVAPKSGSGEGVLYLDGKSTSISTLEGSPSFADATNAALYGDTGTVATFLFDVSSKLDRPLYAVVDVCGSDNWTLLMYATISGNDSVVRFLLETSADLELRNSAGDNAVMLALRFRQRDVLAMFMACLRVWKIGAFLRSPNLFGDTALTEASEIGGPISNNIMHLAMVPDEGVKSDQLTPDVLLRKKRVRGEEFSVAVRSVEFELSLLSSASPQDAPITVHTQFSHKLLSLPTFTVPLSVQLQRVPIPQAQSISRPGPSTTAGASVGQYASRRHSQPHAVQNHQLPHTGGMSYPVAMTPMGAAPSFGFPQQQYSYSQPYAQLWQQQIPPSYHQRIGSVPPFSSTRGSHASAADGNRAVPERTSANGAVDNQPAVRSAHSLSNVGSGSMNNIMSTTGNGQSVHAGFMHSNIPAYSSEGGYSQMSASANDASATDVSNHRDHSSNPTGWNAQG
jgi:hypothetical protein